VTGLVLEDGGDEDEAIAAMLHDTVEDVGGAPMLEGIRDRFGPRVADIVEACSDTLEPHGKQPWRPRKERYLAHLREVDDDGVLRVSLADKVHNARSIVRDYRVEGRRLWQRFATRSAADQLWYYESLLRFFEERRPGPLTEDRRRAVDELAALVAREEAGVGA
jgi:(p)ppGpp synthase/HD superfamily hydrolase